MGPRESGDRVKARLYPAKYGGWCEECGDRYWEGDPIGRVPGYDDPLCEKCVPGPKETEQRAHE